MKSQMKQGMMGIIVGALLVQCATSQAIELCDPLVLADLGFGSRAAASYPGALAGKFVVFGSQTTAAGEQVPVVWLVDNNSNSAAELPIPSLSQGVALGGTTVPGGEMVVVGNIQVANGSRAVLWRKPILGEWTRTDLAPGAASSRASNIAVCPQDTGTIYVSGAVQQNGRWQPVVYEITSGGVLTEQLPVPAGASSEALGIACNHAVGAGRAVCGYITSRSSTGFVTRPIAWRNTGQGWATYPSSVTGALRGQAQAITALGTGWSICGTRSDGARSLGFIVKWEGPDFDAVWGQLPPATDYEESSAQAFGFNHPSLTVNGQGGADQVFGISAAPRASITTPFADGLALSVAATGWLRGRPYPVQQLLSDPVSVHSVSSFLPGAQTAACGQVLTGPALPAQAALFTGSRTFVPDEVQTLSAKYISRDGRFTGLWHADGLEERFNTESSGNRRKAFVDLEISLNSADERRCLWPICGGVYIIDARTESNQPGASGTLNVYGADAHATEFTLLGSHALGGSGQTLSVSANSLDWSAGMIRLRLEFIQNGLAPAALVLDRVQFVANEE